MSKATVLQNAYLTNHWVFHSNSFAMMFVYYKSTKTLRIMHFGAVADLVWTSCCEKKGSRRGPLGMGPVTRSFQPQVLWTACKQRYHLTLSLKIARHGAHALGACQNHTHFGPQITPSGKNPSWRNSGFC